MKPKIQNIQQLQAEIIRLKIKSADLEIDLDNQVNTLVDKISAPFAFVNRIGSFFKGDADHKSQQPNNPKNQDQEDWVSMVSRIMLPILVNKTFFKGSGLLTKGIAALVTQQAGSAINKDKLTDWTDKLTSWIKKSNKQNKPTDYGIPPDSEAF